MLSNDSLQQAITNCVDTIDIPGFPQVIRGKVRDSYLVDKKRLLITTDRISAYDRVLGLIPYKGQVLNQLSAWWFDQTRDILQNHVLAIPDPNITLAREAAPLPVEVVVRGYITGVTGTSLWTMYAAGDRKPYGIELPDGLQKNDPLPHPLITPTTKAAHGHDQQITAQEIVATGLIARPIWEQIEEKAIQIFQRGQEIARQRGLILVDTKYEFGLIDGELALIDEIHTPDSSRFWTQSSYEQGTPQSISKEFLREWFKERGYQGEGAIPPMPDEFIIEVARRYVTVYETLTGNTFQPGEQPAADRIKRALARFAS